MERLLGTSGFPWWWHTREDTVDKIDAGVLTLDTKVYLSAALRAVNAPVLPLDHAWTARALVERADALATALARLAATTPGAAALERANRALVRLSRILVPLAYTTGDPFRHDLALPQAPLAGLQAVRDLARLEPHADDFKFAAAALTRERNR